jgi:hypothetical protein
MWLVFVIILGHYIELLRSCEVMYMYPNVGKPVNQRIHIHDRRTKHHRLLHITIGIHVARPV